MPEVFVIEPRKVRQTAKKRVCAYARVSTEKESQIDSYEFQINYYREKIMKNPDWILVDIYSDQGITGTSAAKRPGFQKMISACQAGEIDMILVKSVSRFARNTVEGLFYIRELKKLNVNIIFEEDNIETKDMQDEMIVTFHNCLSEEESRAISRRIRWGIKKRWEMGAYITASAPYGYLLQNGNLYIRENQTEVVVWINNSWLSGMSCEEIAYTLNYFQVPKETNHGVWTAGGVRSILLNEKYTGDALLQKTYTTDTIPFKRVKNRGEVEQFYVHNAQEAMIDKETAQKVQYRFEQNKTGVIIEKRNRAFTDKIFCECGTKMRYKVSGAKAYWVCQRHSKNIEACQTKGVEEQLINNAFIVMYHKLKNNYRKVLIPAQQQLEMLYKEEQMHVTRIEMDQKAIQIQKQIQVLNRLQSRGHFESAVFMQKIQDLNCQLKLLQEHDPVGQLKKNKTLQRINDLVAIIEKGPDRLHEFSEELFQKIVDKIIVTNEHKFIFYLISGFQFEEGTKQ